MASNAGGRRWMCPHFVKSRFELRSVKPQARAVHVDFVAGPGEIQFPLEGRQAVRGRGNRLGYFERVETPRTMTTTNSAELNKNMVTGSVTGDVLAATHGPSLIP